MMLVSFQWTSLPLLAGAKSVTRRDWQLGYAKRFYVGDRISAWDFNPRNGGQKIGELVIDSIQRELMTGMPDSDYEAEGFAYLHERYDSYVTSHESFDMWRQSGGLVWTLRFSIESIRSDLLLDEAWIEKYERVALPSLTAKLHGVGANA
jgi:hypothetical protein